MTQRDVSYAAGVAYLRVTKEFKLEILLVLQEERKVHGEIRKQRYYKMPIGKFNEATDKDLMDTALREFREETGYVLNREDLDYELSLRFRIPSKRPDVSKEHEDLFFLVLKGTEPESSVTSLDAEVETARFFPLNVLPTPMSFGHLSKLLALIQKTSDFLSGSDLNVQEIVLYLEFARRVRQSLFKKPSV